MPVTDNHQRQPGGPPHSRVSTTGNPPRSRAHRSDITTAECPPKIARLVISGRQPARGTSIEPKTAGIESDSQPFAGKIDHHTGRPDI